MESDADDLVHEDRSDAASGRGFYRLDSNHSSASIFEDVEMAYDEVRILFSGSSPCPCSLSNRT